MISHDGRSKAVTYHLSHIYSLAITNGMMATIRPSKLRIQLLLWKCLACSKQISIKSGKKNSHWNIVSNEHFILHIRYGSARMLEYSRIFFCRLYYLNEVQLDWSDQHDDHSRLFVISITRWVRMWRSNLLPNCTPGF